MEFPERHDARDITQKYINQNITDYIKQGHVNTVINVNEA
jgi:hypothetical protein